MVIVAIWVVSNFTGKRAMGIPAGQFLTLRSGIKLHFHDDGAGAAVVLVHGAGMGASGWSNFKLNRNRLLDAGLRVVLPDMPGFGLSDKPEDIDYSTEFFADVLAELIEVLDLGPSILVGNSMGGTIVLKTALERQDLVAGLVLMGPGGIEDFETYMRTEGNVMLRSIAAAPNAMPAERLRDLLLLQVHDPVHLTAETIAERLEIMATQPKAVFERMSGLNLVGRLAELRCPILGFWGAQDRFNPAEGAFKFVRAVPDARFTILSECGHWVMVERADLFNRMLIDFVEEVVVVQP